MFKLTFRNSQGELVDIPAIAATKVKNGFGAILEQANHSGAVAITRHDTPKAVLLSYEEFVSLVKVRARTLDDLGTVFEQFLAGMQTSKAGKGVDAAFKASPVELGRAAVKAARKDRVPLRRQARRRLTTGTMK